jgi:hypothetical protein
VKFNIIVRTFAFFRSLQKAFIAIFIFSLITPNSTFSLDSHICSSLGEPPKIILTTITTIIIRLGIGDLDPP